MNGFWPTGVGIVVVVLVVVLEVVDVTVVVVAMTLVVVVGEVPAISTPHDSVATTPATQLAPSARIPMRLRTNAPSLQLGP